jgi:hypothetical protein
MVRTSVLFMPVGLKSGSFHADSMVVGVSLMIVFDIVLIFVKERQDGRTQSSTRRECISGHYWYQHPVFPFDFLG